ncbi:hypothetical protein Tco_0378144 [Tanacetum coccineum]
MHSIIARLDQVVITFVFGDRGQGFDPHSLHGRKSFSTFGRTGSSLSTLGRGMAVYISTSPIQHGRRHSSHSPTLSSLASPTYVPHAATSPDPFEPNPLQTILKHTSGFGFYKLIWSVGWDYVTNYAWRDAAVGFDMFGVVSDINQLLSSLTELTQLGSEVQKVQWVASNYANLLKLVKSLFNRLLKVFTRSGPLKDAVEILRTEIVDGGLLQDCLELGSSDLKGVIQILKDVAVQYSSTSHKNEL